VDDDPLICELIRDVLESAEITSQTTSDSRHASVLIREEKFDAVFLDVRMPAPDGIALARQVRTSALNRATPIAMITGESDRHLLTTLFEAGATFVLFKPIDRHRLLRLLRVSEGIIQREARQFQRVKVTCKVSMQMAQERSVGRTLDMSLNGAMVCADKTFSVGSTIQVDLELTPGKASLSGTARVVRVVGVDCMGLHFENVPLDHTKKIQEFLLPLILALEAEVKTPVRSVV
jgi:DNA-binding response OmpR family regulator